MLLLLCCCLWCAGLSPLCGKNLANRMAELQRFQSFCSVFPSLCWSTFSFIQKLLMFLLAS